MKNSFNDDDNVVERRREGKKFNFQRAHRGEREKSNVVMNFVALIHSIVLLADLFLICLSFVVREEETRTEKGREKSGAEKSTEQIFLMQDNVDFS